MSVAEWTDTYGIPNRSIRRSSYRTLAGVDFEPATTEFRADTLTVQAIKPWLQLTLRTNFVQLLQFHILFRFRFGCCLLQPSRLLYFEFCTGNLISVAERTDTYGIPDWRILRSSYRNPAWVEFESTATDFRSDTLTDWAIRSWLQLALRTNFVQLLQFHLCSMFRFHFGYSSFSVATFILL